MSTSAIVSVRRRMIKLVVALLLAAGVASVPVVSSYAGIVDQPLQAGGPQSGSCG